jgi:1-acyl-sn-glycerol-3-phosphate acyltransferase
LRMSSPTVAEPERLAATPLDAPRRRSPFLRWVGRAALRAAGWRFNGEIPRAPKFVIIVAPHTSNWDFVVGVAAMFAQDLKIHWLGKESLFRGPAGRLLRSMGGRPVRREVSEGVVRDVAAAIRAEPEFILALAPEGTRKLVEEWRTGFYRVAEAAGVPILPVWLDYTRKEVGIGQLLAPSGALVTDVAALRGLYSAEMARYPAQFGASPSRGRGGAGSPSHR